MFVLMYYVTSDKTGFYPRREFNHPLDFSTGGSGPQLFQGVEWGPTFPGCGVVSKFSRGGVTLGRGAVNTPHAHTHTHKDTHTHTLTQKYTRTLTHRHKHTHTNTHTHVHT